MSFRHRDDTRGSSNPEREIHLAPGALDSWESRQGTLLPERPHRPVARAVPMILVAAAIVLALVLAFYATTRVSPKSAVELMQEVKSHIASGNHNAAIIELKNLLKLEPGSAEARYLLGRLSLAGGDFARAEHELRTALEAGMEREQALPELGRTLLLQRKFERLLEEIQPVGEGTDEFVAAIRTLRGLAFLGAGKTEQARTLFRQALEIRPDSVDAILGAARIAAVESRLDEAEKLIDRALQLDDRSLDGLLLKADVHLVHRRIDAARATYLRVLRLYPHNPNAHLSMAWLAVRTNQIDAAAPHVEMARKVLPDSPQTNYLHALLEFRQKRFASARQAISRALKASPPDAPTLILAGGIAYAEGKFTDAQTLLLRGLERVPANVGARKLYAATLLKQGQPSSALRVLLPTLQIAADDADLLTLIAQSYLQAGDPDSASQHLERAAKLRPANASTQATLGMAHMAAGQYGPAIAAVESGLRGDATRGELEALMVALHLRQGKIELAERYWNELNRRQPNVPATLQLKAAVQAAKKDLAGARKSLETALMLKPDFVPAAMGLAKLDLDDRDPANARRRLESLLRQNPKQIDVLIGLAELGPALRASEQQIRDWLIAAHKVDPTAPRPAAMLARHHLVNNNAAQAIEVVRGAQRRYPENADLLDVLASAQLATNDTNGALGSYAQLANLRPRSAEVLYRLATVQAQAGSNVAALTTLRKALELQPDHVGGLTAMAELMLRTGRSGDALATARRLQAKTETEAAGWTIEGDVHNAAKKYDLAVSAYERALRIEPSAARIIRLHSALVEVGRVQAADQRIMDWIAANPRDWRTRLFFAETLTRRGQFDKAKELYLAVIDLQPNQALTHNNLAWVMFQTGDARARQYAEQAHKLSPEDPAVLDTLGVILTQEGDTARGIDLLQRAVTHAPNAVEPRLHLAQAWLKAGNYTRAREELTQALNRNPPPDRVAELKRLLASVPY